MFVLEKKNELFLKEKPISQSNFIWLNSFNSQQYFLIQNSPYTRPTQNERRLNHEKLLSWSYFP